MKRTMHNIAWHLTQILSMEKKKKSHKNLKKKVQNRKTRRSVLNSEKSFHKKIDYLFVLCRFLLNLVSASFQLYFVHVQMSQTPFVHHKLSDFYQLEIAKLSKYAESAVCFYFLVAFRCKT